MSENPSENSEMSSVEFVQGVLRDRIAPPSVGMVKARIRHASRRLGWTYSRTKDAWYADPRISISSEEMRDVEEAAGIRYGKQEVREIEELINRASALVGGENADLRGAVLAALGAFTRALDRSRTQGR